MSGRAATRRQALAGLALVLAGRAVDAQPVTGGHDGPIVWPRMNLLDGSTLEPQAWRDTPAVVVFWATWCPFCRRHNANIDRLHRLEAGAGLRVLGVPIDGDRESLRRYMAANDFQFPVLDGMPQLREQFTQRRVIPMTCVVDRRGNLIQSLAGEMALDDVLALAEFARRPRRPAA